MKQDEINTLLNSFFITQEELDSRNEYSKFANSMASIIIDDFAPNYLLNNPYISVYLAHADGSMLLKKMKKFFAFILTAPIDDEYIKKIQSVGFIHHSMRVELPKISYGFWAVGEVLDKLAETNSIIKENKSIISKLLKFVEYVMNECYNIKKDTFEKKSTKELDIFNTQNELYIGFNIHKLNAKKVQLAISDKQNLQLLEDIAESSAECSFGKILKKLNTNKQYEYILGSSNKDIDSIHEKWHYEFREIKKALIANDTPSVQKHNENITSLTNELLAILDKNLNDSLQDGKTSLDSGIKSMKKMTRLFYTKGHQNIQHSSAKEIINKAIEETILSGFAWAIQEIELKDINDDEEAKNNNDSIAKMIRYDAKNIFITIKLKPQQSTDYLKEMVNLLLEALELHFFLQEREISLIKFADEAESANKAKDMFLANMSHELRTPINAITGFSQILMKKKDTPEALKQYVEKINIAGNNLLELVNTILDLAKLESGKMQFNPSLSNISNILNETKMLINPLASKKNITLTMPNIVSLNLYIDNSLFKQVLINLLSNAIKFTPQNGKVLLNISYNSEKNSYKFEVKDNGVGLSPEDTSKLFQAFSQIDNTYQKEHKGTGLGLMISKSIIEELHKGKIWVESEKGVGSSFFIEMPTPMTESNTYTVSKASEDAPNILIVEDSEEYQKILIANLENTHNITVTDTVNKAKDLVTKNKYDFLLLDFFLTDGISSEILQYMEIEHIFIPAIVISAEDEIHISSSLSGSSNLECIINKKDVHQICASIRGEKIDA